MNRRMYLWLSGVLICGLLGGAILMAVRAAPPKGDPAPSAKTAETPEPLKVPDGSPKELLEFIDKITGESPNVRDYDELVEFYTRRGKAVLNAVDKILAASPTDEEAESAVMAKLGSLVMLGRLQDKDAAAKLEAFSGELAKMGRAKLARLARGAFLSVAISRVRDTKSEQFRKLADEVRKHLSEAPLEAIDVGLITTVTMAAESSGNYELAGQLYGEFAKLVAASKDEQIAPVAKALEGAARRMGLVGNPMRLEGTLLDGAPFDWSKYRGKVVLVDFWATWCGPCREELPNVMRAYEAYHDRGFDVVGLSGDRDLKTLENYVKDERIPWATLLDAPALVRARAAGTPKGETPKTGEPKKAEEPAGGQFMAEYYGVMGIPTTLLVDKEGKVVALSARGPELQKHLEKLLGPALSPR